MIDPLPTKPGGTRQFPYTGPEREGRSLCDFGLIPTPDV